MTSLQPGAHGVFNLKYHLILVTAYRRQVISSRLMCTLAQVFQDVCTNRGCRVLEFSGEVEHVHLLLEMNPRIRPCDLIRVLKTISSAEVRRQHWAEICTKLWGSRFWSKSYCLITVGDGATTEIIKRYIQQQKAPS